MTSTDDPYQLSMDESLSETPRTRSSSRNRKPTNKKVPKSAQQRIATCSSQKSPVTPLPNENDDSFMSNINSGFSQFVQSKKRQRDEKKSKTQKRPKGIFLCSLDRFVFAESFFLVNAHNDENEAPNDEIQDIEQVKLAYETTGRIE